MAISSRMNVRRVLAVAMMVACALGTATVAVAQETTGRLVGTVSMKADQSMLPGVAVEALHVPTGTRYTAVTAANGRYNILNVRVGGPYTVTAQISGFRASDAEGHQRRPRREPAGELRARPRVGDRERRRHGRERAPHQPGPDGLRHRPSPRPRSRPCRPSAGSSRTSRGRTRTSTWRTGTSRAPTSRSRERTTATTRSRSTARSTTTSSGSAPPAPRAARPARSRSPSTPSRSSRSSSLPTTSSRADSPAAPSTPSPGADRTASPPRSTARCGTRTTSASKVPKAYGDASDKPVREFNSDQFGGRVGGPILKDKLFFFLSGEMNRRSEPTSGSADGSTSNTYKDPAGAARFRDILINKYGYDPGSLGDYNTETDSDLLFGRLDFNVNESHNVTLRHNYVDAARDATGRTRGFNAYALRELRLRLRQQDELDGAAGQQRLRRRLVQHGPRRLPDDPGHARGADCRSPRSTSATRPTRPAPGAARAAMLAGTERSSGANGARPGHPRGHRRLHPPQGQPHDHDRDPQRVLQVLEPLHPGHLRDRTSSRASTTSTRGSRTATGQLRQRLRPAPADRSSAAQQWGIYAGDQWRVSNALTLNLGLRFDVPRLTDKPDLQPGRRHGLRDRHHRGPDQPG